MFGKREPERIEITAELGALERQLAGLTPIAPRLDRDQLMFEAGRAAALARPIRPGYIAGPFRAGARFWPAATGTMTAASLLLATMLVWQRQSMLTPDVGSPMMATQQNDFQHGPAAQPAVRFAMTKTGWPALLRPATGYLGARYTALTRGVGALEPDSQIGGSESSDTQTTKPATSSELLHEFLPPAKPSA